MLQGALRGVPGSSERRHKCLLSSLLYNFALEAKRGINSRQVSYQNECPPTPLTFEKGADVSPGEK